MVAKAMLLTSNRGFAECGEVFGAAVVAIPASPPRYRHPKLFRYVQNYSLDLRMQINKGAMQHWVGQPRLSGEAWAE
jgi:hypothetical protein